MKKYVIFVVLLFITVGCSAFNNNDNKSATPSNTNPQVNATPAPDNSTATTAPTANPPVAATPQPANPPAAATPEPSNPPVAYKPEPKPVIPPPPAGSKDVPYVTKQQIESLSMNATYEEVSNKLGLGKLVSATEHQAIYQYQGKNGGSAKLTFWDGKLNSKGMTDLN